MPNGDTVSRPRLSVHFNETGPESAYGAVDVVDPDAAL
jgi:hypothetical protein